jgi:hypothetical protein
MYKFINGIPDSKQKNITGLTTITDGVATLKRGSLTGLSSFSSNAGVFTEMSVSNVFTSPITTFLNSENIFNKANIANLQSNVSALQQKTKTISFNESTDQLTFNNNVLQLGTGAGFGNFNFNTLSGTINDISWEGMNEVLNTNNNTINTQLLPDNSTNKSNISALQLKTTNQTFSNNNTTFTGTLVVNNISASTASGIVTIPTTGALSIGGTELRFQNSTTGRIIGGAAFDVFAAGQRGLSYSGLNNRIAFCGISNPSFTCEINGDTNLRNNGVFRINNNQVLSGAALGSGVTSSNINTLGNLTGLTCGGQSVFHQQAQFNGNVLINGDLLLRGNVYDVDTPVIVTDAMTIQNIGTGPALRVRQDGVNDIVDFQDDGVSVFRIANGGEIQNNPTITTLQDRTQKLGTDGNFDQQIRTDTTTTENLILHTTNTTRNTMRLRTDNGATEYEIGIRGSTGTPYINSFYVYSIRQNNINTGQYRLVIDENGNMINNTVQQVQSDISSNQTRLDTLEEKTQRISNNIDGVDIQSAVLKLGDVSRGQTVTLENATAGYTNLFIKSNSYSNTTYDSLIQSEFPFGLNTSLDGQANLRIASKNISLEGNTTTNNLICDLGLGQNVTLRNNIGHPLLNLQGTATQYGIIQFNDTNAAAQALIFASQGSGALNIASQTAENIRFTGTNNTEMANVTPNGIRSSSNIIVGNTLFTSTVRAVSGLVNFITAFGLNVNSAFSGIGTSSILPQGFWATWNFTGGTGETDFINKSGSGPGGFHFYNSTGNGSTFATGQRLMASITPAGTNSAALTLGTRGPFQIDFGNRVNTSETGTVTFNFTFTNIPTVTATLNGVTNNSHVYAVTIHNVSTTGFNFIKRRTNFPSTNTQGVSESVNYIAIG